MDIRMQGRALTLLYRVFLRNATGAHQIPYLPSKTVIPPRSPRALSPVAPEDVGMDSGYVDEFLTALEGERSANLHTLAIARDGKVFCLATAPGYEYDIRHQTHSLCKTVTGLAIGILVGEGKLTVNTPIHKLITEGRPAILSSRMKAITVRHLLSMTTGVMFGEVGSITEEDWVRSYFESSVAFVPGTRFSYNSMNSYLLSVIVETLTGKTLSEFANERIFAPLGIRDVFWESCPRGHTKGGWGLYLSAEDSLKLGEMILRGGTYKKRRIVPREWIFEMAKPHAKTPEAIGDYHYGYHIWVARDGKSLLCNGMLGQNVWISPTNRIVLVTNSANCELFQNGPMFSLFKNAFSLPFDKEPKPHDEAALYRLCEHEARFFAGRAWTHAQDPDAPLGDGRTPTAIFDRLTAAPLLAERNNFGLLPLSVMLMQNNLNGGITSLAFSRHGKERYLNVCEGEECYSLPIGFEDYRETVLTVRGEVFLVRTRAEFCDDTDGVPILKVEVLFPELASVRRLRFYYDEPSPTVILSEQPGRRMLNYLVDVIGFMPRGKLLGGLLRNQLDRETIAARVRTCYEPTLRLGRGEAPPEVEYPRFDGVDPLPFDGHDVFGAAFPLANSDISARLDEAAAGEPSALPTSVARAMAAIKGPKQEAARPTAVAKKPTAAKPAALAKAAAVAKKGAVSRTALKKAVKPTAKKK